MMGAERRTGFSVLHAVAARISPVRAALIFLGSVTGLAFAFAPALQDAMLFPNPDPLFFYTSFEASRHFGSMLDLETFTFGQGFGAFQHPTLLHQFWWIFGWTQSVVLSIYFEVAVLFLGTLAYYRALGGSIYFGIIASAIACTELFNTRFLVDFFDAAVPQGLAQTGFAYFGLAILIGSGVPSLMRIVAGLLLLGWAVTMDWLYASFVVPFIVINLVACVFYLRAPGRILFGGMALLGFGLLYVAGFYDSYDGFTLMSVRLWGLSFWGGNPPYDNLPTSLLIFGGWPGMPFARIFGILAAVARGSWT
jgi:hypothetical protein